MSGFCGYNEEWGKSAWEADRLPAGQEMRCLLWNPEIRDYKNLILEILSWARQVLFASSYPVFWQHKC
jgi:hypothetical protein